MEPYESFVVCCKTVYNQHDNVTTRIFISVSLSFLLPNTWITDESSVNTFSFLLSLTSWEVQFEKKKTSYFLC